MNSRHAWSALACAFLVTVGLAGTVRAQPPAAPAHQSARDDWQWEVRRTPYRGGPVRPGAQLDSSPGVLAWLGIVASAVSYGVAALVGIASGREYAAIPLAGAWLAGFGALGGPQWDPGTSVVTVVAGAVQTAGALFLLIGLCAPDLYLVYDAPIGAPSPFEQTARLRIVPSAPGTDVGISVVMEAL